MEKENPGNIMKILHCPKNVGGNAWGLSRAERKLGLQSDSIEFCSISGGGRHPVIAQKIREIIKALIEQG